MDVAICMAIVLTKNRYQTLRFQVFSTSFNITRFLSFQTKVLRAEGFEDERAGMKI